MTTCDAVVATPAKALAAFVAQPSCLDTAIATLERFDTRVPAASSDLAALYYVRAQRDDEPIDLLRAFDRAHMATSARPASPAALFNQALILEALGLNTDATASWVQVAALESGSPWAEESRRHRDRLQSERGRDAATLWRVQRARLAIALRQNDSPAVERLIQAFPGSAQTYFEEEVLAHWGERPSPQTLAAARTLAAALSKRLADDPCDVEIVRVLEASEKEPAGRAALSEGHVLFGKARRAEKAFRWSDAEKLYRESARLLGSRASPLGLHAQTGYALSLALPTKGYARALPLLDPLEKAATVHRYRHLVARIQSTRAYFLAYINTPVEALAENGRALAEYERLRDSDNLVQAQNRRIGYLDNLGQHDLAWRTAFARARSTERIVELKERHSFLAETARVTAGLGHPRLALLYQNEGVAVIRRAKETTSREDLDAVGGLNQQLSIALRARSQLKNQLGDPSGARVDFDEAALLLPLEGDADNLRALEARLQQVRGELLLQSRPSEAATAFTRALEAAGNDELRVFRAGVLAQRADASERAGRGDLAERDLAGAVQELRVEETATLAGRERGDFESLWSSYFSRSRAIYQLLIRHYVEAGRSQDAFRYAERAKGFEPLDLILRLPAVPALLASLRTEPDGWSAAHIRKHLPPGTFLIEYSVHEDRAYSWVLSRDGFQAVTVPANAAEVTNWTNAIQTAAQRRNDRGLEAALADPYDALIASQLAEIE
ncbi:MAG: hypothetical protein ABI779_18555, partial [Acidobacteriota bacterium]